MAQRKILISDLTIEYEGLFDAFELFKLMDEWFHNQGYEKQEIRDTERVREKGKTIDYEIMPYKKMSDYVKYEIDIRVMIKDMIQTEIKKDNKPIKINKGKITILFSAFLVTDLLERWESKPLFFFLRTIYDKFVNKKYMERYDAGLMKDVENIHTELKAYLNLSRYIPAP